MKRSFAFSAIILGGIFLLAGCSLPGSSSVPAADQTSTPSIQKTGTTTKTGKVTKLENKFYIQVQGQPPAEIDSYNIDLNNSVGKTVTVIGQYSGDTLFVSSVQ